MSKFFYHVCIIFYFKSINLICEDFTKFLFHFLNFWWLVLLYLPWHQQKNTLSPWFVDICFSHLLLHLQIFFLYRIFPSVSTWRLFISTRQLTFSALVWLLLVVCQIWYLCDFIKQNICALPHCFHCSEIDSGEF